MDTKNLPRVEIKDADKGQVVAVFSTFNIEDHDGDVTVPGAFEDGAKTTISAYNHASWGGALPVGDGYIKTTNNEAQLHGQFYMDTQVGADTFVTVKRRSTAGLQEWSYGFDITKKSFGDFGDPARQVRFLEGLKVHEVSPVLLGAGIGTRTLVTKSAQQTFAGEASAVLAAVSALADRAAEVLTMRREKGKSFGAESAALLKQVEDQIKRLADLLTEPDEREAADEASAAVADANREYLRFLAMAHSLAA